MLRELLRRVEMKVIQENRLDVVVRLHTSLPPGKIGLAPWPNPPGDTRSDMPMGPNAGETEVLIPAGYVREVYDARFALSDDRKDYDPVDTDTPTMLPEPGLPFSLVFRAEPGAEDRISPAWPFCRMFCMPSSRRFPGRSGTTRRVSSSTATKPGAPPFGETSQRPPAPAVAMRTKGACAMKSRAYPSSVAVSFLTERSAGSPTMARSSASEPTTCLNGLSAMRADLVLPCSPVAISMVAGIGFHVRL
jgi:hypothetical protein